MYTPPSARHIGDDEESGNAVMSQGGGDFKIPYDQQPAPTYEVPISNETYQANKRRGSVDAAGYQIPVTQEHVYSEVAPIYSQPVKKGDRKSATPPPVPPKMNSAASPTVNPWAFKGNLRADQGRSNTNAAAAAPSKGKAPTKAERERLNKQAILENSDSSAFGSSSTDDPIYENVKRRGRRS
jgi:hypothetical protein